MKIAGGWAGNCLMLRITVTEHPLEERWILQGRLHKGSVPELLSTWTACRGRKCHKVVDLNEVTAIDRSGEDALMIMLCDGADIIAGGVYTRHLIEELKARRPRSSDYENA